MRGSNSNGNYLIILQLCYSDHNLKATELDFNTQIFVANSTLLCSKIAALSNTIHTHSIAPFNHLAFPNIVSISYGTRPCLLSISDRFSVLSEILQIFEIPQKMFAQNSNENQNSVRLTMNAQQYHRLSCSLSGWLVDYPVLYTFKTSTDTNRNNLSMVPLMQYQLMLHIPERIEILKFSVPVGCLEEEPGAADQYPFSVSDQSIKTLLIQNIQERLHENSGRSPVKYSIDILSAVRCLPFVAI
mmetsp:Transcript_6449/g.11477  ORF Transcript_6449/g.11477 Transcript_6449/m.11477 type:complete len:244 (-) Transcript_6449:277-1008(-)